MLKCNCKKLQIKEVFHMEIITQNYEKILENLIINNFSEIIKESKSKLTTDNQVFNYISILDTLDNKIYFMK